MVKRFVTVISLAVFGLLISLGCSSIAQTNQPAPTPSSQVSPTSPTSAPNSQISAIDQQYMLDANEVGLAGIMLGELALQRSDTASVQQFAQAEIEEQTQVRSDLSRVAQQVGIELPSAPGPKAQAAMNQLSQLSGESFDQAFLAEGGINAHLENAAIYQREAAFGQNQDLVAIADRGLPLINSHFNTASELTNYQFAQVPQRFNNTPSSSLSSPQNSPNSAVPSTSAPQ